MSEDVLLRFLDGGLIDVGGDDAKLEKLRATATDLATSLGAEPSKATAFALVAFDPEAPADDPVVHEALAALKRRWTTYVNTFSGVPISVVRAMLLDALMQASAADDRVGVAFVSSARNALPFMEAGNEQAIWTDVVTEIETRIDARSESEWATPSSITVPRVAFELPQTTAPKAKATQLNRENIKTRMRAAVGPHFNSPQQGNVATGGNPHWPQANAPWVTEFGERMGEALAEVIEASAKQFAVEPPNLSTPFKALLSAVTNYVDTTLQAVTGATTGLQRRTNLLWWKEALFSPSARVSYRDLPLPVAATLMAFDLHQQVPSFSPASVAAFLSEAVGTLPSLDRQKTYPLTEIVTVVQKHPALSILRTAAKALVAPPVGRGPVVSLIAYPDAVGSEIEPEFRRLTGVPADVKITLPQWATWTFRELLAGRAAREADARPNVIEAAEADEA
ncbi:hypothetical protein J6524_09865 [Bradyrhizobium sp. WSM 1738]|uniref:GTPase-associated system all-helical protein GASH n=1 Tax=Bradyrhizobium hereditatis TaxID=2821405 RepID=UPI001CE340EA|nr:GTPase-associated system all-helical protein GASH [Bradyrhizobium hereditatis]MCA6115203.1 hypothetical protein [Bradyrhizobium hereditatis]